MKYFSTNTMLTARLSCYELWFLAGLFSPGWIFGIENPMDGLSEEEIGKLESTVISDLSREGLISSSSGGKQIQIDEMLSAMVYSSIHSNHILLVKNLRNQAERFFHFLPEWQLEFARVDGDYELTLFKDRTDLFKHIMFVNDIDIDHHAAGIKFTIRAKDLEASSYLFENGKIEKATQIFIEDINDFPNPKAFLEAYSQTKYDLRFDLLLNRDDEEKIQTKTCRLIEVGENFYWITYNKEEDDTSERLSFMPVVNTEAEHLFNEMLPKE